MSEPEARASRAAPWWALLGAVALAAIYARAALLNLTTALVGGDIDAYENMWNNWWLKTALFDLHQNPFHTDYIYYPTGVNLYFHTFAPVNGLLSLPFNLTLGYLPATNLLLVGLLAAATFCAWLFLRDRVGHGWAAFGGAALYTYAHHLVVEYLNAGQTERLSAEWLPLYLFFLLRALHGRPRWDAAGHALAPDTRRWPLWAGLAVLTLLAASLADWQYLMVTVFLTLLYFAFVLATRRPWRDKGIVFARLAAIGGLYTLLISPLLIATIQEALANPWLSVSYESALHSFDVLSLLGPGPANPGYLACAVALLGLWVAARRPGPERSTVLFWALAALLFWVMSLGPTLVVGGRDTGVPLPYGLLQNLPVLSIGRDPARYTLAARLGVGVLAAFGLRRIMSFEFSILNSWFRRRRKPPTRTTVGQPQVQVPHFKIQNSKFIIASALALFVALDLGGWVVEAGGVRVDPPDWPALYQQIAADHGDYALLELPLFTEQGRGEDHYQMYQVLHQKPRFGGRWARDHKLTNPNNFVKHASLFNNLYLLAAPAADRAAAYPTRDFLQRTDYAAQGLAILNYYKVGFIVLYKDASQPPWDQAGFQRILAQVLGPGVAPSYEDGLLRAYRVPAGPAPANPLTLDVGDGWYDAAVREDGTVYRWADTADGQAAEFDSMNLTDRPLPARLHFTVYVFARPRTLTLAVNGVPAVTLRLAPQDGEQAHTVDLTLPPGNNRITVTTPEPPQPTGNPHDARLLSFGMYGVSLEAQPP